MKTAVTELCIVTAVTCFALYIFVLVDKFMYWRRYYNFKPRIPAMFFSINEIIQYNIG